MFFSRALLAFFAVGAISAVAAPSPAPVEKRADVSDVIALVSDLDTRSNSLLTQINTMVDDGSATEEKMAPLVSELVANIQTTTTSLEGLGQVDDTQGGSKEDVANRVAATSENIIRTSENIRANAPQLYGIVLGSGLDLALFNLLIGLDFVLAGVLLLVSALLKIVGGLLAGLGFVLVGGLIPL